MVEVVDFIDMGTLAKNTEFHVEQPPMVEVPGYKKTPWSPKQIVDPEWLDSQLQNSISSKLFVKDQLVLETDEQGQRTEYQLKVA